MTGPVGVPQVSRLESRSPRIAYSQGLCAVSAVAVPLTGGDSGPIRARLPCEVPHPGGRSATTRHRFGPERGRRSIAVALHGSHFRVLARDGRTKAGAGSGSIGRGNRARRTRRCCAGAGCRGRVDGHAPAPRAPTQARGVDGKGQPTRQSAPCVERRGAPRRCRTPFGEFPLRENPTPR